MKKSRPIRENRDPRPKPPWASYTHMRVVALAAVGAATVLWWSQSRRRRASVREQYEELAGSYNERWAAYVQATLNAFMSCASEPLRDLTAGDCVLDVGTGTGAVPRAILRSFPGLKLSAADLSESMIETGRHECPAVDFVVAPAESLPFASGSFAAATTLSSLHFWTDPEKGLREMHLCLKPGGRVVLSDWCHDFVVCKMCAWYLWLTPGHSKADWSILTSRDVNGMLTKAGFVDVAFTTYKVEARVFGRWWLPRWGMMAFVARKAEQGSCAVGRDSREGRKRERE